MALIFQTLILTVFLLWIWALLDCLQFESGPEGQRLPWLLVILFGAGIGALIYLFLRRPQRHKAALRNQIEGTDSAFEARLQEHRQRWQRKAGREKVALKRSSQ